MCCNSWGRKESDMTKRLNRIDSKIKLYSHHHYGMSSLIMNSQRYINTDNVLRITKTGLCTTYCSHSTQGELLNLETKSKM